MVDEIISETFNTRTWASGKTESLVSGRWVAVMPECEGHPCEDDADRFPHAGIGEIFYCDGRCQRGAN